MGFVSQIIIKKYFLKLFFENSTYSFPASSEGQYVKFSLEGFQFLLIKEKQILSTLMYLIGTPAYPLSTKASFKFETSLTFSFLSFKKAPFPFLAQKNSSSIGLKTTAASTSLFSENPIQTAT